MIYDLIEKMDQETKAFQEQEFIAPVSLGGDILIRIAGIVQKLTIRPRNFNGWGIFRCDLGMESAHLVSEATYPERIEYLQNFKSMRAILMRRLDDLTWLAYPASEEEMRGRGKVEPFVVRLAENVSALSVVKVRHDGVAWWYEGEDTRAHVGLAEALQEELVFGRRPAGEVRFPGLTPEMRTAYEIVRQRIIEQEAEEARRLEAERLARQKAQEEAQIAQERARTRSDEERIRGALNLAGGSLVEMRERGSDVWTVTWRTQDGERHVSSVDKKDLTIASAGICLDGGDRAFDLQSLVGVVERRERW